MFTLPAGAELLERGRIEWRVPNEFGRAVRRPMSLPRAVMKQRTIPMTRIAPIERDHTSPERAAVFDAGLKKHGRMTNMKRTLLHSIPSYDALMAWYPLFDEIKAFIGERLAIIFAHAISAETECLICTTFMRRILIDWGENPDTLALDERGEALVAFGQAIARPFSRVNDALYSRLSGHFNAEQIVALTAFAALMMATNIVNNALEVPLDTYLYEYRKAEPNKVVN